MSYTRDLLNWSIATIARSTIKEQRRCAWILMARKLFRLLEGLNHRPLPQIGTEVCDLNKTDTHLELGIFKLSFEDCMISVHPISRD